MANKIKFIVSFMIIVLLIGLLSTLAPTKSSYAYNDGLLNGKKAAFGLTMQAAFDSTNYGYEVFTDNDESTFFSNTAGGYFVYNLSTNKNLTSFKIKSAETGWISVLFYNEDKQLISNILPPVHNGLSVDYPVNNVRYVAISVASTQNNINEFDVFGQDSTLSTPETTAQPTATPTPEPPSGKSAILIVTLTTGDNKEFDLPMSEVNAFLNWYDSASGSNRYGIDKHDNNKGPFSKRTEYVIHDKILSFEVSEYTATE